MARLTDYSRYADAQRFFSKERLWNLFEGDRDALNITHECLDRHRGKGLTIQIALADGGAEKLSLEEVSDAANRIANWTQANRIAPGARVALTNTSWSAFTRRNSRLPTSSGSSTSNTSRSAPSHAASSSSRVSSASAPMVSALPLTLVSTQRLR